MKFKFLLLLLFGLVACQTNVENTATSEFSVNAVSRAGNDEFALERNALNKVDWFKNMYNAYEPNQAAIAQLKKVNNKLSFVVFGGGWCSDTRKTLPKFYKVIDEAGIPAEKISLYGVDHEKKSQEKTSGKRKSDEFGITRVPEFVVFFNGQEMGRLNEKPSKSLEEDLLALITN